MAVVSISKASKISGIARSTLYRKMDTGELSTTRRTDGSRGIDTSELVRVFGNRQPVEPKETPELVALREQNRALQEQLRISHERENRLLRMVERNQQMLEYRQEGLIGRVLSAIGRARGTTAGPGR